MSIKSLCSVAAIAAVSVGFARSSASANVILTIDITTPTAVVFTGTTAPALTSNTRPDGGAALLAIGALSMPAPSFAGQFGAQTLASTASGGLYNFLFMTSGSSTFSIVTSGTTTQSFVAGQRALSGTWVGDFSFVPFAAPGTIGDLVVRDRAGNNLGIVIGQYQIIPAPGAAALCSICGLMVARRRR